MKWKFTLSNAIEGDLELSEEPIGWADIVMNMKRDMKWHGVFFEYAISLRFYEEGYDFIKNIYDTQGIDALVEILVEQQCEDAADFEEYFNGKLLMGKCIFDCKDDCIVDVPIEQSGCLMKFKNRLDQSVDLSANKDFDGNSLTAYTKLPFSMNMKPKAIVYRSVSESSSDNLSLYVGNSQTIANGVGTQSVVNWDYLGLSLANYAINELSLNETEPFYTDSLPSIPSVGIIPYSGSYVFAVSLNDFSVRLRIFTSAGLVGGTAYYNCSLGLYINNSLVASTPVIGTTYDDALTSSYVTINASNIVLNHTQSANQGDDIKVALRIEEGGTFHRHLFNNQSVDFDYLGIGTSPAYQAFIDSEINVKGTILTAETPCDVFAINETLSRIVEAITIDCMRVKSNYFGRTDSQPYTSATDGCGSLEVLTKGLLLRQFESNMPVTFEDCFNSLSAIHNIGLGIEPDADRPGYDRVRIESMEYFYDSATILLDCDNVPAIKKKVMAEWFPSTINIGYEKWETESSMGLDEFCTRRSYRTTLSEVKNNITRQSKFIASGYSIEVTRNKEYVQDSTKDWRLDNDIFIICVKRSGGNLVVEQGSDCADTANMTDIIDPNSIYNYRISPVRNFMRWMKAYLSVYFSDINAANAKFIFTNGDGNFLEKGELINGCVQEGDRIAENDDLDISVFDTAADGTPIFKNELHEFDYPLSIADLNLIRANPRGLIRYRKQSTDAWSEGYIYSIAHKPNTAVTTFTLLPKF